jgi:hypothetical protein
VGADLRELPLAEIRVPVEERAGDRQLEHAVAEEFEPLVRRGPLRGPGGVRVDLLRLLFGQLLDQAPERLDPTGMFAIDATKRSRRPGRRSESSARPRRRS